MTTHSEENHIPSNRVRRPLISGGITLLVLIGVGYAWTRTPSYSLYRIKQALEAHDYATFSQYVDVDSVLDHALTEFADDLQAKATESHPPGPLAKAFRKGFLKRFAREAGEIAKAGLEIAVEQAIKDPDRQLPEIPAFAIVGALWQGRTDSDMVSFPVKVKKRGQIEVKMRRSPEGVWRVVEVENLPVLVPALQSCQPGGQHQPRESDPPIPVDKSPAATT
jgi:hypothetical protein